MTVQNLIKQLQKLGPAGQKLPVYVASDAEGNNFSKLDEPCVFSADDAVQVELPRHRRGKAVVLFPE